MPILSLFPSGGSEGHGLALDSVSNITTLVASGKAFIKWTDPEDINEEGGGVLAAWAGTILVRKAGSAPVSRRDGTIVLDSTKRDQYYKTYFCDSGLSDGVTYYYKLIPYTADGVYSEESATEFTVVPTAQVDGIDEWTVGKPAGSIEAGDGKISLSWTDPAQTIESDGVTLATWGGTTVVVKEGSYPTGKNDPDAVRTIKTTSWDLYHKEQLVISGLVNGTEYYVAFYPETTDGGICESTSQRTTATANRISIAMGTTGAPTQSGYLSYTGNVQYPVWDNYDETYLTISGEVSGIDVGSYTVTFTPKSDYRWSDGTTTPREASWSISKAACELTLSATSVTLNSDATTATVTVNRPGDGVITATSNNTSIATVSVSGETLTISSVNDTTGTAVITVSVAESSNYFAASNITISVTASFKPTASTTATSGVEYTAGTSGLMYSDINLFAEAISNNPSITNATSTVYIDFGDVHRKISVGDRVSTGSGTFDIIGFNHDTLTTASAYGSSTKTGKAGITFQQMSVTTQKYPMNSSDTNSGGWKNSLMRTETIEYVKNSYLPYGSWRNIAKPVNKLTGKGGGSSSGTESTSDTYFFLSEVEVFGKASNSVYGEGTQYAYYKAGNSPAKTGTSTSIWWLRSPQISNSTYFCAIGSYGSSSSYKASTTNGVAFAFCV